VSRLESPWTDIKIAHLDGAVSRIPETTTAFGNRRARFCLVIRARWEGNEESGVQIALGERVAGQARSVRDRRCVREFPRRGRITPRERTVRKTIIRLEELKSRYDPEDVFRASPNVPPAQRQPADAA